MCYRDYYSHWNDPVLTPNTINLSSSSYWVTRYLHGPMRPKARGLAQHGGLSGWLERRVTQRVWFGTWWRVHKACPGRIKQLAPVWGWPNTKCKQNTVRSSSRKEGMVCYSIVDPCLKSFFKVALWILVLGYWYFYMTRTYNENKFLRILCPLRMLYESLIFKQFYCIIVWRGEKVRLMHVI